MSDSDSEVNPNMFNGAGSSDEEITEHWQKVCTDLVGLAVRYGLERGPIELKSADDAGDIYYGYYDYSVKLHARLRKNLISSGPKFAESSENLRIFDAYFFLSCLGLYQQAEDILEMDVPEAVELLPEKSTAVERQVGSEGQSHEQQTPGVDALSRRRREKNKGNAGESLPQTPLDNKISEVLDELTILTPVGQVGSPAAETGVYREASPKLFDVSIDPDRLFQEIHSSERITYSPLEGLELFCLYYAQLCSAVRLATLNPEQSVELMNEILEDLRLGDFIDGGKISAHPDACRLCYQNPKEVDDKPTTGTGKVIKGSFGQNSENQGQGPDSDPDPITPA